MAEQCPMVTLSACNTVWLCQPLSWKETGIAPGPSGSWSRVTRRLWGDRRCCWGERPLRSSCSGSTSPGRPPSHRGVWKKWSTFTLYYISTKLVSAALVHTIWLQRPLKQTQHCFDLNLEKCTLLPHLSAAHTAPTEPYPTGSHSFFSNTKSHHCFRFPWTCQHANALTHFGADCFTSCRLTKVNKSREPTGHFIRKLYKKKPLPAFVMHKQTSVISVLS